MTTGANQFRHPLNPIDPAEIHAAREALVASGLVTDNTRFAYLGARRGGSS